MGYLIASHTDIGIKKKTNQDAYMIKEAEASVGRICFSVLCDGMGGLANGELASATVIRAMEHWFEKDFPLMIDRMTSENRSIQELFDDVKQAWNMIVKRLNAQLADYAAAAMSKMGTTIVALLLIEDNYLIINVGDSRAYALTDRIYQLTKDQSLVQYQIDMGQLRPEDAESYPHRNVLLQCVGASKAVVPDFYEGTVCPESLFLLCSDGFRHKISAEEIYGHLMPDYLRTEDGIKENILYLTELVKSRKEVDNISVVAIKVTQEEAPCLR